MDKRGNYLKGSVSVVAALGGAGARELQDKSVSRSVYLFIAPFQRRGDFYWLGQVYLFVWEWQ